MIQCSKIINSWSHKTHWLLQWQPWQHQQQLAPQLQWQFQQHTQHDLQAAAATRALPQQHLQQVPLNLLLEQVQQLTRWRCQLLPTNIPTILLITAPGWSADNPTLSTASPMAPTALATPGSIAVITATPMDAQQCLWHVPLHLLPPPHQQLTLRPRRQLHFYSICPTFVTNWEHFGLWKWPNRQLDGPHLKRRNGLF